LSLTTAWSTRAIHPGNSVSPGFIQSMRARIALVPGSTNRWASSKWSNVTTVSSRVVNRSSKTVQVSDSKSKREIRWGMVSKLAEVSTTMPMRTTVSFGAVAVSSSIGPWWARLLGRSPTGSGPSTKLGLAYPTARRFRTGVSLAMFSLIVFSLTFIAVLSGAFGQQTEAFTDEASAGFDALVRSNAANPVTADALTGTDEVVPAP